MSRFQLGGVLLGSVLLLAVVWWQWGSVSGRWAGGATPQEYVCDAQHNNMDACERGDWLAVEGEQAPRYCDFARQLVVVGHGLLCQYVGYVRLLREGPPRPSRSDVNDEMEREFARVRILRELTGHGPKK
jgi:hypothetical protein